MIDQIFYFIPHPVIKKECKSYLNVSYTVHDYHSKIRDRIHIKKRAISAGSILMMITVFLIMRGPAPGTY